MQLLKYTYFISNDVYEYVHVSADIHRDQKLQIS